MCRRVPCACRERRVHRFLLVLGARRWRARFHVGLLGWGQCTAVKGERVGVGSYLQVPSAALKSLSAANIAYNVLSMGATSSRILSRWATDVPT